VPSGWPPQPTRLKIHHEEAEEERNWLAAVPAGLEGTADRILDLSRTGGRPHRYSARLIDDKDNGDGGNMIKDVFTTNRILDNDPFYVTIVP
jgi:hypothetical protein